MLLEILLKIHSLLAIVTKIKKQNKRSDKQTDHKKPHLCRQCRLDLQLAPFTPAKSKTF